MLDFNKTKSIGGWLSKNEADFLYNQSKTIPRDGVIVEIGSWKGRSTVCLGLGAKDGNGTRIVAIDPHAGSSAHNSFGGIDTFQDFIDNINRAEVSDFIEP